MVVFICVQHLCQVLHRHVLHPHFVIFDSHWRRPLEVWSLLPDYGNAASGLQVGVDIEVVLVHEADYLLGFREVRHVAHRVRSSRDEPEACSGLVSARDDDEVDGFLVDVHDALLDESADERLHQVMDTALSESGHVWFIVEEALVLVRVFEGGLYRVGEGSGDVVVRREVETLRGEDLLEHVDVVLVSRRYLVFGRIFEAQRHELEFGRSVHEAVHDVRGELCFGDDDQVGLHLQLDEAVDRECQVRLFLRVWSDIPTASQLIFRNQRYALASVKSESLFTHMATMRFFSSSRTIRTCFAG